MVYGLHRLKYGLDRVVCGLDRLVYGLCLLYIVYISIALLRTQVNGTATLWSGEILYEGGVEEEKTWAAKRKNCSPTIKDQPSASAEIVLHVSKLRF